MKRYLVMPVVFAFLATSCLGGGAQTRTVLVDYKHDEFASAFIDYFPNHVEAHPGDTIVFRQAWSGEPHSVTMGTAFADFAKQVKPYLKKFAKGGYDALPQEEPPFAKKFDETTRWMEDDNGNIAQNGAQPCFLRKGLPPKDAKKPCTKAQQRQPLFDGRYNFYNSGFIPYAGPNGDTYTVKLSENAKPGENFFFCNYHGPFMSGYLVIKPKSQPIMSQQSAAKLANEQIGKIARPLLRSFREAEHGTYALDADEVRMMEPLGRTRKIGDKTYFKGWLAGHGARHVDSALIDEFIPSKLHAKVGEKLTWTFIGGHTLSFHVPKYFPIVRTAKDGTLSLNPKIKPPFGGAPDISKLGEQHQEGPPTAKEIDGGSWDGKGFWSTGFVESFESTVVYHLTITKPGTYKFACLVHPPMVGTLTVTR